jgi:uncharacterized protein with GYD domain
VEAALTVREEIMPIFISQGRYSREAMRGMVNAPEDRTEEVTKLITAAGGRLLSYYLTFGEYDWLLVVEARDEQAVAAAVMAAAAGGGVTDIKTNLALTGAEAKQAFQKAGELAKSFRSAGQGA